MTATEIKIVEYEPHYAASIAEMWNASGEGWEEMQRFRQSR